ncbi:dihydroxyacetone phosphate acyltransferase [Triplophysa dalaica]|uniref:dihydroxyacetone phosphate acyltransferase n=1 Tax=Triplophysa dalaica TaxID=1582913 RepID=UPI0024DFA972|nr:dihydroxyacetone phosphate acyltransferase [Triplophysa dalaica]
MSSRSQYSSRRPMLKKRDDFEDILEERRSSSDLRYALRCYSPTLYKGLVPCRASMLKSIVLQSDHLQHVIKQVSSQSGESSECVTEEASLILDEMAQSLQLSTVRFFVYTLSKAFKRLFRSVCVNEEGIQRLQQAVQEHPVVLLPSHRSYMDFLMMSYILFMYDLPLPVIAAGMDFMSMKFIGEMLRMSGAFFIRRSFGGDKLYWAVFSEYVKTMLRNGYAPIEFFLEGTRSRTCKSLTPKTGLLNIVMEPFFKGEVFDVSLVPVSISYERILEESLYARELLGVPKPKETTSGLLKARRILSEDYGSMHVYFGHPVSVRSLAEGKVNRCQHNLLPRHIPQKPSAENLEFLTDAAFRLVRTQEENMVLKPWVLIATLLLQNPDGLDLSSLGEQTDWLRHLALALGAFLDWPDQESCARVISCSLALHRNLLSVSDELVQLNVEDSTQVETTPEEAVFQRAVVLLSCASYRNEILHVFVRPALLAVAIQNANSHSKDDIYNCFNFLRDMFSNEFILCPGDSVQDFEEACYLLVKRGALQVSEHEIVMSASGHRTLTFLCAVLEPFVKGYQVVCRYLCENVLENLLEKDFIPALRNFALKLILAGRLKCYEVLSSDLQKNALAALLRLKAVRKVKVDDQVTLKENKIAVNSLEDMLGGKIPTQKPILARL